MESKPSQQDGLVVTIEAQCGSFSKETADFSHQELSEGCLTVLAQGMQVYACMLLRWHLCMADLEHSQHWMPEHAKLLTAHHM